MAEHRIENTSSVPQALKQMINRREMLRKHFSDWEEPMNYQKKQEKFINQPCWKSEKFKDYVD